MTLIWFTEHALLQNSIIIRPLDWMVVGIVLLAQSSCGLAIGEEIEVSRLLYYLIIQIFQSIIAISFHGERFQVGSIVGLVDATMARIGPVEYMPWEERLLFQIAFFN
jgi:hypothetical protein